MFWYGHGKKVFLVKCTVEIVFQYLHYQDTIPKFLCWGWLEGYTSKMSFACISGGGNILWSFCVSVYICLYILQNGVN